MARRPLLPLPDYQRIYQVIYSVLEASESVRTHRSCMYFASAGVLILRDHYGLEATLGMGCMALMVDEKSSTAVVYGREENGTWIYDSKGFHAWVECEGWLIDFMAPIMGHAFKEDGAPISVPRKMLQRPLADGTDALNAIQHEGDFFFRSDPSIAHSVIDSQGAKFNDLLDVCLAWFRRPPKALPPMALAGNETGPKPLVLRAPSIVGAW